MPIYEYACRACGHEFEAWQKMSDPPVRTCPKCKAKKVEKLISQTSFHLKGGGWYKDLYSSSKPPGSKDGGKDGGTGSGGGEAGAGGGTVAASADKSSDKAAAPSGHKPTSGTSGDKGSKKKSKKASAG